MNTSELVSDIVHQAMKSARVTGASISIVNGDEPAIVRHFGYADKQSKKIVDDTTLFKIGSITKVFTASAVMQLSEKGLVDIDVPLIEYLPDFTVKSRFPEGKPITIRDILCHHSGLPCDNLAGYFTNNLESFHSAIPYLQNAYTVCPPGQRFYYSNLGYELLGMTVSRMSGMPFHKYMDGLLANLGMKGSTIALSKKHRESLSKPYRMGKEQTEEMMKGVPEGGICSTASDMALFMNSILASAKGLFDNSSTLSTMQIPQYPQNAMDMSFVNGLGWFVGKPGLDYGGKVIWHDGGTPHFFSLVVLIPERRLGITILTNSSTGAPMNHRASVDILQLLLKEFHGIAAPAPYKEPAQPLPANKLQGLTGTFFTISGLCKVSVSGNHLVAKMPSGTFRLLPFSDRWFGLLFLLFGFFPLKIKKLSIIRVGVQAIDGEKVFALEHLGFRSAQGKYYRPLPVSQTWNARIGSYVCTSEKNPRLKSFKLRHTPYGLVLSSVVDKIGRLNLFLNPVNNSEAIIEGYGRYAGETIIASENSITLFGLEFEKVSAKA
jgi:CubicO group peptidase (beta-lactamase class C family)